VGATLNLGNANALLCLGFWGTISNYARDVCQAGRKCGRFGLLLLVSVLLAPGAASAEAADGSGTLALAGLVGIVSPLLGAQEKVALNKLLDGKADFTFPKGKTILLESAKLTCKASNVDIKSHSCDLSFGKQDVALKGRAAQELYATLIEIGVPPDAGAGSVFEAIGKLDCKIDPNEVIENAGGGAHCDYAAPN
jgi:hypothetical protein